MSLPLPVRSAFPKLRLKRRFAFPIAGLTLLGIGAPTASAQTDTTATVAVSRSASSDAPADAAATTFRGGLSRTGYTDASVSLPLSIAWQNTTMPLAGNQSTPVLDDGVVFLGTAGRVYALNAVDGSVKWMYPTETALADSDVAHPGLFDSPATVADGKVFIGNDDGKLYALDETNGTLLFQVTTGGPVRSAPAVSDGVIYFGSSDSKFYAVREDNQKPVWGGEFKTQGAVNTGAAVSSGSVYFVDGNNTLYSAALASGRATWSIKFPDNVADSPPILADGVIIVGSQRDLYGISPATGATRWHFQLPANLTAQVALSGDGGKIYAATADDNIVAVNTQGSVVWSTPLESPVSLAPVAAGGNVVAITKTGIVRVLDAGTGRTRWTYPLVSIAGPRPAPPPRRGVPTDIISAVPLVTTNAIYTLADDGTVTAFGTSASDELPPTATLAYPYQNRPVPGAEILYAIQLNDVGTGINPNSMSLKVDGAPIAVNYDVNSGYILVNMTQVGLGRPSPVALPTLTSGTHALTLAVSDWRGNQLNQTWNFTVNDALNPAGSALPAQPPTPGAQSALTDQGPPALSAGGSLNSSASSGAVPGGTGARPTSGAGSPGPVPGPGGGSGPTPSPPSGGGAAPVPPSGGGSSFPPAPPI